MNLAGIVVPGTKVAAVPGRWVLFAGGAVVQTVEPASLPGKAVQTKEAPASINAEADRTVQMEAESLRLF